MIIFIKFKDTGSEFTIKFANENELREYLRFHRDQVDFWRLLER